ncbi:MAG: SPASM domain-containing protein, partial [Helicobacter sp.]|nr:SPASM domain-containing protein [Helicobacter sp.]
CIMCPFFSKELKEKQQTDFFKQKIKIEDKVVYEAIEFMAKASKENPNVTIGFTAAGEATLDTRLPKFINYARNKGIPWRYIVTNGTLLEQRGIELLDAGLNRMTISIDGATEETYKKIRGTDLIEVERGVRKCVEYARKLNNQGGKIEFDLNCVLVNEEIEKEKALYLEKWSDCRDIISRIYFTRLVVYDIQGNDINKTDVQDREMICSLPWNNYAIDCYGDVTVCCTMDASAMYKPVSIGNVKELGVEGVWSSSRAKLLRQEQLKSSFDVFSICHNCSEKFKACFDENTKDSTKHELNY